MASQGSYLAAIPPQRLPGILKTALTPALLDAMLRACLFHSIVSGSPAWCGEVLQSLTQTPRFTFTAMGISRVRKAELSRLWSAAESQDVHGAMAGARASYKL